MPEISRNLLTDGSSVNDDDARDGGAGFVDNNGREGGGQETEDIPIFTKFLTRLAPITITQSMIARLDHPEATSQASEKQTQ